LMAIDLTKRGVQKMRQTGTCNRPNSLSIANDI
jgi:hypothetical protein